METTLTRCNSSVARAIPLAVHAAEARALVAALRDAGIDDHESVQLSLESETGLTEAVGEAVAKLAEIEAMQGALDRMQEDIGARKAKLREKAERVRGAVVSALELAGLTNVGTPLGTAYVIHGKPGVRIVDEAAIPAEFIRAKTTTSPDRAAIGRALAAGQTIPGAALGNGESSLGVRR
jgi:hypothetical protein